MIWAIIILGIIIVFLGACFWFVWRSKSTPSGAPTVEEARITSAAISEAAHLAESGARQAEEIKNADLKKLLSLARNRLLRLRK